MFSALRASTLPDEETRAVSALSSEMLSALREAESAVQAGSIRHAAEGLQRAAAAASAPSDGSLLCALGALCLSLGEAERAHHWLRRALCHDASDLLCRHLYALALWRTGRLREAAAQLSTCLEGAPGDVDLLMSSCLLLRELGDMDGACRTQDRTLQLHPRDADVWAAAGSLAWALGQSATAVTAYRSALVLQPQHADARAALERIAAP
jgi:tetratricopeptide (TPR) repeat protein